MFEARSLPQHVWHVPFMSKISLNNSSLSQLDFRSLMPGHPIGKVHKFWSWSPLVNFVTKVSPRCMVTSKTAIRFQKCGMHPFLRKCFWPANMLPVMSVYVNNLRNCHLRSPNPSYMLRASKHAASQREQLDKPKPLVEDSTRWLGIVSRNVNSSSRTVCLRKCAQVHQLDPRTPVSQDDQFACALVLSKSDISLGKINGLQSRVVQSACSERTWPFSPTRSAAYTWRTSQQTSQRSQLGKWWGKYVVKYDLYAPKLPGAISSFQSPRWHQLRPFPPSTTIYRGRRHPHGGNGDFHTWDQVSALWNEPRISVSVPDAARAAKPELWQLRQLRVQSEEIHQLYLIYLVWKFSLSESIAVTSLNDYAFSNFFGASWVSTLLQVCDPCTPTIKPWSTCRSAPKAWAASGNRFEQMHETTDAGSVSTLRIHKHLSAYPSFTKASDSFYWHPRINTRPKRSKFWILISLKD